VAALDKLRRVQPRPHASTRGPRPGGGSLSALAGNGAGPDSRRGQHRRDAGPGPWGLWRRPGLIGHPDLRHRRRRERGTRGSRLRRCLPGRPGRRARRRDGGAYRL